MPHELIAEMSGNHHVHKTKESPFEHDPCGYGRTSTPLTRELNEKIEPAVRKERKIAGLRE